MHAKEAEMNEIEAKTQVYDYLINQLCYYKLMVISDFSLTTLIIFEVDESTQDIEDANKTLCHSMMKRYILSALS